MNHPRHLRLQTFPRLAHNASPEKQKTAEKLMNAIGDSHDVLVSVETLFPLTLFPTTLTVDRTKVTITQRDFFKAGEVVSIRIEDVLNVTANVGPMFGSVKISSRFFNPEKPYVVDKLRRADALRVKRILQGYLLASQKDIDCSQLSTKELARTLDELGGVAPEERV